MAPVAINDPIASEAVAFAAETALGADHVIRNAAPIMASEDFAFMLEQVPGSFFFVGQDGPFPHHPAYVFDPDVIPTGEHHETYTRSIFCRVDACYGRGGSF